MTGIPIFFIFSPDLTYPDAYYVDRGGDTYSRYYTSGSYGKKLDIPYFKYI